MTNHVDIYACVVMLFVQKCYLLALLTIVLYSTRLALILGRYIQQPDRKHALQFLIRFLYVYLMPNIMFKLGLSDYHDSTRYHDSLGLFTIMIADQLTTEW